MYIREREHVVSLFPGMSYFNHYNDLKFSCKFLFSLQMNTIYVMFEPHCLLLIHLGTVRLILFLAIINRAAVNIDVPRVYTVGIVLRGIF